MMSVKHGKGFSLSELIVVILIVIVLSLLITPTWQDFQQKNEANSFTTTFRIALVEARQTAMSFHQSVIMCGSSNGQICDQQWHKGLLLFVDSDKNNLFGTADQLLSFQVQKFAYGVIKLKAFGQVSSLVFTPERGIPLASNASFYYCPINTIYSRALAMSRMGHVRDTTIEKQNEFAKQCID